MAILNALKRAASSSYLFSKFAPSWLLNANAGRSSYFTHKQMPDSINQNAMFLKGIGVFGRAEGPPDLSGMKNNGMTMKLWWLTCLRDEEMKKRLEESGMARLLDSEDVGRDFREELPWLKDRLDQVVRFRVEQNTVFIEGEEENDERRISGRIHLPRYLDVMNGAEGEIKKGVLKLWLPDMCPDQSDDDNGCNYEHDNNYGDIYMYNESSGDDEFEDNYGDDDFEAANPGNGDGAAKPEEEDGAAQLGDGVMHPDDKDPGNGDGTAHPEEEDGAAQPGDGVMHPEDEDPVENEDSEEDEDDDSDEDDD